MPKNARYMSSWKLIGQNGSGFAYYYYTYRGKKFWTLFNHEDYAAHTGLQTSETRLFDLSGISYSRDNLTWFYELLERLENYTSK
jgi:hypothetical protein